MKYSRNMKKHWDTRGRSGGINKAGYLVKSNGPRNSVVRKYAHRIIMEQFIGRELLPTEHVHHKNGNKLDNRIENLEIVNQGEHSRLHAIKNGLGKKFRPKRHGNQFGGQLSEEKIKKILELLNRGIVGYKVAKKLNISATTVSHYRRKYANNDKK